MLIVRARQMRAFAQSAALSFEDEMVAHSRDFSPRLCEVIGDEQVRLVVRQAIARAQKRGFTYRGPTRLYIELVFLYGSAFDTDPQYGAIAGALHEGADEMARADRMHEGHLQYLDAVCGPDAVNVRNALQRLLIFSRSPLELPGGFIPGMLHQLGAIFPEKARYVGEAGMRALIDQAITQGRHFRFSTARHGALMVALMFAFGHGCALDPLYPWIGRTLTDDKVIDAAARAERLERKAVSWLRHVLGTEERMRT